MAETVKKISIRQEDSGLYDTKPIGVDAENIDGKISLDQLSDDIIDFILDRARGKAPAGSVGVLFANGSTDGISGKIEIEGE